MIDKLTEIFLWLRNRVFFRITRRTLVMLTPIAIIGAVFQMLSDSFFLPDSLFYNILNLQAWLPSKILTAASYTSLGLTKVTFGLFGIYCAYFAAMFTARIYHKDAIIAGASGIIVLLFISYRYQIGNNGNDFNLQLLDFNAIFFAIIIGYLVGQIFHWLGPSYHHKTHEHSRDIRKRIFKVIKPMFVAITIGVIIGVSLYLLQIRLSQSPRWRSILVGMLNTNNIAISIPLIMLCMFLAWLGFNMPLSMILGANDLAVASANLNYAFDHNSSWDVPSKYLGHALVESYGTMGSSGLALAMILVIFYYGHQKQVVKLAKITLIPVIFNSSNALFVGIPVLFNPVYLIPWILIPTINMLLASIALFLHLIPASVYPVLSGTPGPLIAFVATNGAIQTAIFSISLMIIDAVIFLPFIILSKRVEVKLHQREVVLDEMA